MHNYVSSEKFTVIAGPCAVETEEQCLEIAKFVKKNGSHIFRGGVFKPRSSPFSFQGLGEDGLPILNKISKQIMPVITEITHINNAEIIAANVDMLQIGTRNMHNVELLKATSRTGKPILLKRGYAALIEEEWLMSAKYISLEGNDQIIMCERGIRTFEPYTRNTLDLSAVCAIKELTEYPIIVDPSHATGKPSMVIPLSLAALAVGADGIMVEVHNKPEKALCDGHQALTFKQFELLMTRLKEIAPLFGRLI
jgi:3-deoxy-7-phosphoheptulonate synthase